MDFVKNNEDAIITGVVSISLGILTKYFFKWDLLPLKNAKQTFLTFTLITASGMGANELKSKYLHKII